MRLLLALCFIGVALAVSPLPRFSSRRRAVATTCPAGKLTEITVGTPTTTNFNPATGKYTGGTSPLDGHDTTGETPTAGLVDYCHIDPALCTGSKNFCTTGASKNVCCPHAVTGGTKNAVAVKGSLGNGCSAASVLGMARLFMPQVSDEAKLATFIAGKSSTIPIKGSSTFAISTKQTVNLADYSFAQGEILANKILGMACAVAAKGADGAFPDGASTGDPYVCADNFVLDGHHRFGAFKFFNTYLQAGSGKAAVPSLKVNKLNVDCVDLIAELAKVINWDGTTVWDGTTGAYTSPTPVKDLTATAGAKFSGLIEVAVRFGSKAHASVAAARKAYVEQTRAKLAEAGVELKGGDEALASHFDYKFAPELWA